MDPENILLPGDRLKKRVEKFELDSTSYYYQSLMAQSYKECFDKCLHTFKSSNMSQGEKGCLKNCTNAFQYAAASTFFSMNSALVLNDMEKDAKNFTSKPHFQ